MFDKEYQRQYYLKNKENILRRTLEYYYNNQITNEHFIKRKSEYDREYNKKRIAKKKQENKSNVNISKGITITFQ